MEKVKLTKRAKQILRDIGNKSYKQVKSDYNDLIILEDAGLVKGSSASGDRFWTVKITEKGENYLVINPKLSNPSIWDDKKYIITTAISILAFIASLIAIIIEIKYHVYGNC